MRWLLVGLIALMMVKGDSTAQRAVNPVQARPVDRTAARDSSPTDDAPDEDLNDLERFAELAMAVAGPEPIDDDQVDLDEEDLAILLDQPLRWHTDYETVLALSERSGKPIFVRFR